MYFSSKISYTAEMENGELATVSEEYLVKDESFAGVEAAIYAHCEEQGIDDFKLESVAKKKVNNLIFLDDFPYFEFKVIMISESEKTGKEKRLTDIVIVGAKDFEQAFERVKEDYKRYLIPWSIESGKITKFTSYVETTQEEIEEESDSDQAMREQEDEFAGNSWPVLPGKITMDGYPGDNSEQFEKSRREMDDFYNRHKGLIGVSGPDGEEGEPGAVNRTTIIREDIDVSTGRSVVTFSQGAPDAEPLKEEE